MDNRKEKRLAKYQERVANHICVVCGKETTIEDYHVCFTCRKRIDSSNDDRKALLLEAGLCYICGKEPAAPNRQRCEHCLSTDGKRQRDRRIRLKELHICISCGNTPALKNRVLCEACSSIRRESQRKRRIGRVSKGLCLQCGEPVCSHSCQMCEKHWLIYNQKSRETYFDGHRLEALDRDSHCCQICSSHLRLDVHHIDGNAANNDLDNLITLCGYCHKAVTALVHCAFPSKVIEFVKVHYQV